MNKEFEFDENLKFGVFIANSRRFENSVLTAFDPRSSVVCATHLGQNYVNVLVKLDPVLLLKYRSTLNCIYEGFENSYVL